MAVINNYKRNDVNASKNAIKLEFPLNLIHEINRSSFLNNGKIFEHGLLIKNLLIESTL